MGLTKTEIFSEEQNEIAIFSKAVNQRKCRRYQRLLLHRY